MPQQTKRVSHGLEYTRCMAGTLSYSVRARHVFQRRFDSESLGKALSSCRWYIITRRPLVQIVPESVRLDDNTIKSMWSPEIPSDNEQHNHEQHNHEHRPQDPRRCAPPTRTPDHRSRSLRCAVHPSAARAGQVSRRREGADKAVSGATSGRAQRYPASRLARAPSPSPAPTARWRRRSSSRGDGCCATTAQTATARRPGPRTQVSRQARYWSPDRRSCGIDSPMALSRHRGDGDRTPVGSPGRRRVFLNTLFPELLAAEDNDVPLGTMVPLPAS